jgi:hypothetical protein
MMMIKDEKILDEYERFMHWLQGSVYGEIPEIKSRIEKHTAVIDYIIKEENEEADRKRTLRQEWAGGRL